LRPAVVAAQAPREALPDLVRDESEAPLIFVSFGTVVDSDLSLLRMVLEALRDLDARLLATTGPNQDPAAVGDQPANVSVVGFIPREDVLGSVLACCAATVTHAGAGTMLRGLAHGLPQLSIPRAGDQFINAAACEKAGAGLTLRPHALTAQAVRAAAERMLSDPGLSSGAARVADEIGGMPPPEKVARILADRFAAAST
jgi:MGT family glycosyltransferase